MTDTKLQPTATAVRALEWFKHPSANMWRAETVLGLYQVAAIVSPASWTFDGYTHASGFADGEEAAKAAAQAHYEAAIRSALVEPWQTIDSAPDTGVMIIVYDPRMRPEYAVSTRPADGSWWNSKIGCGPTHWMPLPTPPSSKEGEG